MTVEEFNVLDFKGKGEAVFAKGSFVDDREEYGLKVQLYRLEAFYVEVFYDADANEIKSFRALESNESLGIYISL